MRVETHFLQAVALFILLSLIPVTYFLPYGTSMVWTVVIPVLPVFIVSVGYNRWRKLCPLAWIAALGQVLQWLPKRKVSPWFEKHYYTFQFSLLFLAFTARLLLLNFNGTLLAIFFLSVAIIAFITNLVFAGKTWCNYFCPVGLVEKIYCGSNALLSNQSSACSRCVACKSNCPDIDLEKGYWKENSDGEKRAVFYAFAGLVFGFYAYYYAIDGSWSYYFDGAWTQATCAYEDLLAPGFYFLPIVPKLLAAPLTLLFFSGISYLFFSKLEKLVPLTKWAQNKDANSIEHIVKAFAAFSAFNIFYIFAGAPTYLHYPLFYAVFHFIVIVVSSIVLWKEIFREERFYLQERFAKKILSKWKGDSPAPGNLKEIYYTYANQQENQQEKLDLYKETVLELLSDGTLSKEDFTLLDKIREQLGLSEDEHKKILRSLKRDNSDLFDEEHALSSEKIYQLKLYKEHLQELLTQNVHTDEILKVQQRFHIDDDEHQRIYDDIVHNDNNLESRIQNNLKQLQQMAKLIAALYFHQKEMSATYLVFSLQNSFKKKFELLSNTLTLFSPKDKENLIELSSNVLAYLERSSSEHVEIAPANLFASQYNRNLTKMLETLQDAVMYDRERLNLLVREHLSYQEEELTTAILYYFYKHKLYDVIDYNVYIRHECTLISEITRAIKERSNTITKIETMAYLHMVPLFTTLDYDDLYQLSLGTKKISFRAGKVIVQQGDAGDSLYIIAEGDAVVTLQKDGRSAELARLSQGDYIGEVSIVSSSPRTATVTALKNVEALQLTSQAFDKLLNNKPYLALRIMKDITERLLEQRNV